MYEPGDSNMPAHLNRNKNLRIELVNLYIKALESGDDLDWKTAIKLQNKIVFSSWLTINSLNNHESYQRN